MSPIASRANAQGFGSRGTARPSLRVQIRLRNGLMRWFTELDEGEAVRWAFAGLVLGLVGAVAHDIVDIYQESRGIQPAGIGVTVYLEPETPMVDGNPGPASPNELRKPRRLDDPLRRPLAFELKADGVMSVEGNIDIGSARRFADRIEAAGESVRVLSLDSPGGSLEDAMAIARLVRERGIATEVADGSICASSCPLLMAGGVSRMAGERATIAVHQFYAAANEGIPPAQAMSDAQTTTARISRHLAEMGVDPALWLHALDTPPQALYHLSGEELAKYGLVTGSRIASR